jgi:hypothetical protein
LDNPVVTGQTHSQTGTFLESSLHMLRVHETVKLSASAAAVWEAIGDFGNLSGWHPAAVTSTLEMRGEDTLRIISIPGGGTLVEKLEESNPEAMSQRYTIVEGPLPVANYHSTLKIVPAEGDACSVDWSGTFDADGADDAAAMKVVSGIYTAGLSALKKRFGEVV